MCSGFQRTNLSAGHCAHGSWWCSSLAPLYLEECNIVRAQDPSDPRVVWRLGDAAGDMSQPFERSRNCVAPSGDPGDTGGKVIGSAPRNRYAPSSDSHPGFDCSIRLGVFERHWASSWLFWWRKEVWRWLWGACGTCNDTAISKRMLSNVLGGWCKWSESSCHAEISLA